MSSVWFVLGMFVGATIAFVMFAVLVSGRDDRCADAATCAIRH